MDICVNKHTTGRKFNSLHPYESLNYILKNILNVSSVKWSEFSPDFSAVLKLSPITLDFAQHGAMKLSFTFELRWFSSDSHAQSSFSALLIIHMSVVVFANTIAFYVSFQWWCARWNRSSGSETTSTWLRTVTSPKDLITGGDKRPIIKSYKRFFFQGFFFFSKGLTIVPQHHNIIAGKTHIEGYQQAVTGKENSGGGHRDMSKQFSISGRTSVAELVMLVEWKNKKMEEKVSPKPELTTNSKLCWTTQKTIQFPVQSKPCAQSSRRVVSLHGIEALQLRWTGEPPDVLLKQSIQICCLTEALPWMWLHCEWRQFVKMCLTGH